MGNIYVISDLHGQGKAFFDMLETIRFSADDKMYIVGDVIDRGPDGIQLLQYIQKQKNMEMLLGNHEDMMLKSYTHSTSQLWIDTWMFNGGGTTLQGLKALPIKEQVECLAFVRSLPLYKILEVNGIMYLLVHAGMNLKEETLEDACMNMDEEDALWIREPFFNSPVIPSYYIIFGHTPTGALIHYAHTLPEIQRKQGERFQMVFWNHRIGIDCGAAYGKNLGCLRLNDMEQFYVKI